MPLTSTFASSSARGFGGLRSFFVPFATAYNGSPVAGYALWLDGEDLSTITKSGNSVSQWSDKSVNARAFTQATNANQPQTETKRINNRNVIFFDGVSDILNSTSTEGSFKYLHTSGGATLFAVLSKNTAGEGGFLSNNGGGSGAVGAYFGSNGTIFVTSGVSGTPRALISSPFSPSTLTPYQLTFKINAASNTAGDRAKSSLNGGGFTGTNTSNAFNNGDDASAPLSIGFSNFEGSIAEIILYSGILSDGDISTNVNYLAAKWGL